MRPPEASTTSLPLVGPAVRSEGVPELVVISGKGGTGKTSLVASFAVLEPDLLVADCDVDAADLHLVLAPEIRARHAFRSGHEAVVRSDDCDGCSLCSALCRFGAVTFDGFTAEIDPLACEGCGLCVELCPIRAIDFVERRCGEWYISRTPHGGMVHARLDIGAENSGKLVSTVRDQARRFAADDGRRGILVDGPPGVGCPVIASITGAAGVLVVTEPTVSGAHDMERVLELADHFDAMTAVCVNRWDLNPEAADRIEDHARRHGASLVGRVRYDREVTRAQIQGRPVTELGGGAADDIRAVWRRVRRWLGW
ncbi:MAG: ATP-binding protein [Holophagae bacterium]